MSKPLISVILPVYNAEKYLEESIKSILQQSYSFLELIIINDGSTDKSKSIIDKFTDVRIRPVHLKINAGLVNALNHGLQLAKGEYVSRMDADDISRADRLNIQLQYLKKKKSDIVGSFIVHKGGSNKTVKYPYKNEDIKAAMLFGNPMVHPSIFFKRKLIDDNLFHYDANWKHVEDYELWIRLMNVCHFSNVPEPLLQYRISDDSVCFKNHDEQLAKNKLLHRRILDQLIPEHDFSETELNWIENPTLEIEKNDIVSSINFIKQLNQANKQQQLFDEKAFAKKMMQQFYQTCIANKKKNVLNLYTSTLKSLKVNMPVSQIKLMVHKLRRQAS